MFGSAAEQGWRRLTVLGLLLLCLGCGYRFVPGDEKSGSGTRKAYVAAFSNNTSEANIETIFRNAFIDQLIRGRGYQMVSSGEEADVVLRGDIKNLVTAPLAYRGDNLAVEKRITVTLNLALEQKNTGKSLWRADNLSLWEDYTLDSTSITAGQISQRNALLKLAENAAEKAYRLMVADF